MPPIMVVAGATKSNGGGHHDGCSSVVGPQEEEEPGRRRSRNGCCCCRRRRQCYCLLKATGTKTAPGPLGEPVRAQVAVQAVSKKREAASVACETAYDQSTRAEDKPTTKMSRTTNSSSNNNNNTATKTKRNLHRILSQNNVKTTTNSELPAGQVVLFSKLKFFRLREAPINFRPRGRRRGNESCSLKCNSSSHQIICLMVLLSVVTILASSAHQSAAQQEEQQQPQGAAYGADQVTEAGSLQMAYYNEPQPLVYMALNHEFGSGDGGGGGGYPSSSPGAQFNLQTDLASSSSSSVSPPLITAKCWSNYENDNDCKQINVITGGQQQQQGGGQSSSPGEDDSIITPVVIFEASSTLEPPPPNFAGAGAFPTEQQQPAFLAPPYFSSTLKPDANNIVLARHRTPPTANDVYAAPPAGATILSSQEPAGSIQQHRWPSPSGSQGFGATPSPMGNRGDNDDDGEQPVTQLSTSNVFVATPQPKKPPKTTTASRKCRDENDDDCDEPDESDNSSNNNNNVNNPKGENDADDDQEDNNEIATKMNAPSKGNDDDDDGDDNNEDNNSSSSSDASSRRRTGPGGSQRPESGAGGSEQGSGNGPHDDNEDDDDDDDDPDSRLESSGSSEPLPIDHPTQAPRFVDVTTVSPQARGDNNEQHQRKPAHVAEGSRPSSNGGSIASTATPSPTDDEDSRPEPASPARGPAVSRANQDGATIEVVVHPTLPPTFPITTTGGSRSKQQQQQQPKEPEPTNMPDDTVTVTPVFPPSTSQPDEDSPSEPKEQGGQLGDRGATASDESAANGGETNWESTTTIDLSTFRPIPIPTPEPDGMSGGRRPSEYYTRNSSSSSDATSGGNNDGGGGSQQQPLLTATADNQRPQAAGSDQVAPKHKFDVNQPAATPAPIRFGNPWQAQPARQLSYNSGGIGGAGEQQQQQRSRFGRPPPEANQAAAESRQVRIQSQEMLPTLLLYSSIVILSVTALIFVIMALAFWRRNNARQRALLGHKAHLMNGAGGGMIGPMNPHQMIGSASHASQLMANQLHHQQPSLLSTYAPGKGLTMGKVTTSLMKPSADGSIAEEDEDERMILGGRSGAGKMNPSGNLARDQQGNGSLLGDNSNNGGNGNNGTMGNHRDRQQATTSSWSTEADQTTTTSSGSQKTDSQHGASSQQLATSANGPHNGQQQHQQRPQYPNSLSDGRQNSSSISDSQGSPDGGGQLHGQEPSPAHHQRQPHPAAAHHYSSEHPSEYPAQPPLPQQHLQQQQQQQLSYGPANGGGRIVYNHQQQHPQLSSVISNPSINKGFNSSRSVENLHHDGFVINGHPQQQQQQQQHPHPHQSPYFAPQQPALVVGGPQRQIGPAFAGNNGLPPLAQRAYLPPNDAGYAGHPMDANGGRAQSGGSMVLLNNNMDRYNFNGPPISPARVAMNPLATLSRRYPPGAGLNRNIYSEDSSSLMTASPSLARTSSSSSFAFTGNQQALLPSLIRAKPLVDATGRVFNDYTQTNNGAPPPPPPVSGRKDRSEAWYV